MEDNKFRSATYVRGKLLESVRLKELVGKKIYPLYAPKGTEGDYIIVTRSRYDKQRSKDGVFNVNCEVLVQIYTTNYDRSVELAEEVDKALDTGEDNLGVWSNPIQSILIDSLEDFEDDKIVQELLFKII